jgi:hypothetical protein
MFNREDGDVTAFARRRWLLWLVVLIALAGLAYSAAGWAMASSFAAALPERRDHRQAAVVYLALSVVSAVTLVVAGIVLARRAHRRSGLDSPPVYRSLKLPSAQSIRFRASIRYLHVSIASPFG